MVYIVHFTSRIAYKSIQNIGAILTQSSRAKLNLRYKFEGGFNRRISFNNEFSFEKDLYDEGYGVYFRILRVLPIYVKEVAIIFDENILSKYGNWFINTEENFGFKMDKNVFTESLFSGEYGKTIYDIRSPDITERSELIIPHDVNLIDAIMTIYS